MQVNEFLVFVGPIIRSIGSFHTGVQLIFYLDAEVISHVLSHGCLTVSQLAVFCSENFVLLRDYARPCIRSSMMALILIVLFEPVPGSYTVRLTTSCWYDAFLRLIQIW